jgi:hypothetical protein
MNNSETIDSSLLFELGGIHLSFPRAVQLQLELLLRVKSEKAKDTQQPPQQC